MSAFWDMSSIIQLTPTRRISCESSFGTPSQNSSGSSNSNIQFNPTSPPKAVFVVPPPSLLLNSPLIRQTSKFPLWASTGSWSEASASLELSQIMRISKKQIENRLGQNGIGWEKFWRRQQGVVLNDLCEPFNVPNVCISIEDHLKSSSDFHRTVPQNPGPKKNIAHNEFREDLLNSGHLRKAKLMFLYTRYPNSTYLKSFFPEHIFPDVWYLLESPWNDLEFTRLDHKEYFYINIERYVRTLITEGVQSSEGLRITSKHTLFRTLIRHYNRGNANEIPSEFSHVIEITALEFLTAITSGADSNAAWKKKIYKTIATFDQPVPEKFRSCQYRF